MSNHLTVVTLNQNNWYAKSFNVLIPLKIQGKQCKIITPGNIADTKHGTINVTIEVENKTYSVPSWAIYTSKVMTSKLNHNNFCFDIL